MTDLFNFQNPSMPIFDKQRVKMKEVNYATANKIITENHYSHCMPCCELALGFYVETVLNCVIVFGQSATYRMANSLPSTNYWELVRLFSFDWAGKNIESYCIGQALKYIDKNYHKDLIVSFADPSEGHLGVIYQATNWLYCGFSDMAGNTIYRIDGDRIHSRSLYAKYGTSDMNLVDKLQKDNPKSTITTEKYTRKHRYIYLLGSRKQRKELRKKLKYKVLPYPKFAAEGSRENRTNSIGEGLGQFQDAALE
ncbi:MAG: hypothetical protein MUP81_03310 [Dehalococcoidia bacterium]|nr:hypothetical protein [Dehalococcoidia bacterium]